MRQLFQEVKQWLRTDNGELMLLLILFLVSILILLWAYRWGTRKVKQFDYLNEEDLAYFKMILQYKVILAAIISIVWLPNPFKAIIVAPFSLAMAILPLLVFVRILKSKYGNEFKIDIFKINSQQELNENVAKLLDSENFLTALRSTLPRGAKDEEYGLDYIPYMLKNIEERRNKFSKSAQNFLVTAIGAGFVFVGVTLWFAYIILDEDSIGSGQTIRVLATQVNELDEKLSFASKDLNAFTTQYKKVTVTAQRIESLILEEENKTDYVKILDALATFNSTGDMVALLQSVEKLTVDAHDDSSIKTDVAQELSRLIRLLYNFEKARRAAIIRVPDIITNMNKTIAQAEKEKDKSNNRVPEIIKRLILSFVVISFFLTILRFLTNQYKSNYDELIKAERDDLNIRKLYIALKTAGESETSRQIVINQLIAEISPQEFNKGDDKESLTLAKDLLAMLSKKL